MNTYTPKLNLPKPGFADRQWNTTLNTALDLIDSSVLPLAGGTLTDGSSIAFGTGTGTKLGTATSQRLGFFGATPIMRPPAYTQTYSTADRTISAYTPSVQTTAFTGQDNAQAGTPYAKLSDLNALRVAYENLRAFTEDLAQALNAIIDDHQALGLAG